MSSKVYQLASKSVQVYENLVIEHYGEHFKKQQQLQIAKFLLILVILITMFTLALMTPMWVSSVIKTWLI